VNFCINCFIISESYRVLVTDTSSLTPDEKKALLQSVEKEFVEKDGNVVFWYTAT